MAIEACRQLKEQGVAFRYRILGIGPWERRLRTLIEQYQLEDVVEMPGFKPSHEVKAMLDDADVFLLPSVTGADGDMEGIPVALMEAMAVGIPVVSTLHSGIPELVEADKSGWLVPENDARALAQRLAAFSQLDTDELAPVVKRAREKSNTILTSRLLIENSQACCKLYRGERMPFKKLSRRTFLTASSALAFLHTPFARALPARQSVNINDYNLTTGSPHLNKPSAKGKRSSCPPDWFATISTPASSFLLAKRYTSWKPARQRQRAICLTGRQPGDRGGRQYT